MNDFNSGQFKTRMKEMAAQVDFYSHFSFSSYSVPEKGRIFSNKGLTHLKWVSQYDQLLSWKPTAERLIMYDPRQ